MTAFLSLAPLVMSVRSAPCSYNQSEFITSTSIMYPSVRRQHSDIWNSPDLSLPQVEVVLVLLPEEAVVVVEALLQTLVEEVVEEVEVGRA